MAGALTERDFVAKLERAGFGKLHVHERQPLAVDDLARYPLFTDDLLRVMRELIPPRRQDAVARAIVVSARR